MMSFNENFFYANEPKRMMLLNKGHVWLLCMRWSSLEYWKWLCFRSNKCGIPFRFSFFREFFFAFEDFLPKKKFDKKNWNNRENIWTNFKNEINKGNVSIILFFFIQSFLLKLFLGEFLADQFQLKPPSDRLGIMFVSNSLNSIKSSAFF